MPFWCQKFTTSKEGPTPLACGTGVLGAEHDVSWKRPWWKVNVSAVDNISNSAADWNPITLDNAAVAAQCCLAERTETRVCLYSQGRSLLWIDLLCLQPSALRPTAGRSNELSYRAICCSQQLFKILCHQVCDVKLLYFRTFSLPDIREVPWIVSFKIE